MPGHKEGISTSAVRGYNLGIYEYIDKNEKIASAEAIKYMLKEQIINKYFLSGAIIPGIPSLYKNNTGLDPSNYEVYKNIQPVENPINITNDFFEYFDKFRIYIYEYLYGNKTELEVLRKIEYMTEIYTISLNRDDNDIGYFSFILLSSVIIIMLASLIFLFFENFDPFFDFLSTDFWILSVTGSALILSVGYTKIGAITSIKCHLSSILLNYGITLNIIPILHKLIENFQGEDKILDWISKHKYIFIMIFIGIDTILLSINISIPYDIENIIINEGPNFQLCEMDNIYGKLVFTLLMIIKILIIFIVSILIFIEWNVEKTRYDLRFIVAALYADILSFIIFFLLDFININNYIFDFLIKLSILFIISLSNYSLIFGYRLIWAFFKKQDIKLLFIKDVGKNFINETDNYENNTKIKTTQFENSSYYNNTINQGSKPNNVMSNFITTINNNNNGNSEGDISKTSASSKSNRITKILMDYHYST